MENTNGPHLEGWVDQHLAQLTPPEGWQADTATGLVRFRRGRQARSARNRALAWSAAVVVTASAGALAFPSTRVLARRCVDACLAEIAPAPNGGALVAGGIVEPALRQLAPDFDLPSANGSSLRLSALRGNVVLLNFWATWCGPCRFEVPSLIEMQGKYRQGGFQVVGVAFDDDGWQSVTPFAQTAGIDYRLVLGDEEMATRYGGVEALPETFLIDRAGRIAARFEGLLREEIARQTIEYLLAEHAN